MYSQTQPPAPEMKFSFSSEPETEPLLEAVLRDMAETFSAIQSGKLIEIACSDPTPPGGSNLINKATFYRSITPEILLWHCKRHQKNAYFLSGVREVSGTKIEVQDLDRTSLSKDELVESRNIIALDTDFDSKFWHNGDQLEKASPEERLRMAREIVAKALPKLKTAFGGPWLILFTGGGIQIFYKTVKNPILCKDKEAYKAGYEALMVKVAAYFEDKKKFDPTCKNPGRLFRLPGSVNWKNKHQPIKTEILYYSPDAESSDELNSFWNTVVKTEAQLREDMVSPERRVFPGSHKEALKQALTFEAILGHCGYQKWDTIKPQSNGETLCSSPWNRDSNPSCFFSEGAKIFNDFSSGKGGDILRFLAEMAKLDHKRDFPKVIAEAEKITGIKPPMPPAPVISLKTGQEKTHEKKEVGRPKKHEPQYEEYEEFFKTLMPKRRRDVLSGELKIWTGDDGWQSVFSRIDVLSSHALDSGYFNKNSIKHHLSRFEETHKKELLVEIPEWDGIDRIKQIAACVHSKNVSQLQFEELMKEWGATMFRRIHDPKVQNRIVILKSKVQGLGKTSLVGHMLEGLDQLKATMSISRNDADNFQILADHLAIYIDEFDQVKPMDSGTLKAWITQEEATFRKAYGNSHKRRKLRCSFITSCNIDEILQDPTGGRRFIIFDLEKIDWDYPKGQSPQILAQWQFLAEEGYQASAETNAAMNAYINDQTPPDPTELLLEDYDARMKDFERQNPSLRNRPNGPQVTLMLKDIANTHQMQWKRFLGLIKRTGRSRRAGQGCVYLSGAKDS